MHATTSKEFHLRVRLIMTVFMSVVLLVAFTSTAQCSALHEATKSGDLNKVEKLLTNGADVNSKDSQSRVALHLAVISGNVNLTKLLIKHGAQINVTDYDGNSPLLNATWKKRTRIIKLLINSRADVNMKNKKGESPLHWAAKYVETEIASLFIMQGAKVNNKNNTGYTPLHWASTNGRAKVAKLLIAQGANPWAKSNNGNTPLHLAAKNGNTETVKLLIEYGAKVNVVNDDHETPIESAQNSMKSNQKTIRYLGEHRYMTVESGFGIPVYKDMPPVAYFSSNTLSLAINTPPTTRMATNHNAYAVVIGIEKYREKLPDALYAVSDAETVANYLTTSMGFEKRNVALLVNDRATKGDIEKYLGRWLTNRANKPDAKVFIYFSGHGAPDVKTKSAYIVPYNGDPTYIADTGYPLDKLYANLGKLKAKEIVVALDSCFSGAGGRSVIAKGARPLALEFDTPFAKSGKIVVLSASSGVQASSSYESQQHGLFTYYLLKGLHGEADKNKSGKISVKELYQYISPKVETIALEEYNNEQTPQLFDPAKRSGKITLIGK